jgi:hypothetical protein
MIRLSRNRAVDRLRSEGQPYGKDSIMLSKQKPTAARRALRYAVLFVAAGAVSWISVSGETLGKVFPAGAPDIDRVRSDDRPGMVNNAPMRTWGEDLSADAVDGGGIENDLDGNASALISSPLR